MIPAACWGGAVVSDTTKFKHSTLSGNLCFGGPRFHNTSHSFVVPIPGSLEPNEMSYTFMCPAYLTESLQIQTLVQSLIQLPSLVEVNQFMIHLLFKSVGHLSNS